MTANLNELAGMMLRSKWRQRIRVSHDVPAAARQLRKQGCPLALALILLTRGTD